MNVSEDLLSLQDEDGCFPSVIKALAGQGPDRNGFVTALVVRGLRNYRHSDWNTARDSALSFVRTCGSTQIPGGFSFWPDAARPAWASSVPADSDDTAIMLSELLRHGWEDSKFVLRSICKALLPFRIGTRDAALAPSWVVTGSFLTWLSRPASGVPNVVDCCVNTNIAALMAQVGARHLPGYEEATRTVTNGIVWAGADRRRLDSLTPFYPSVRCLIEALEHAVECGAVELEEALSRLSECSAAPGEASCDRLDVVCRGAYSRTLWHSTALKRVRQADVSFSREIST